MLLPAQNPACGPRSGDPHLVRAVGLGLRLRLLVLQAARPLPQRRCKGKSDSVSGSVSGSTGRPRRRPARERGTGGQGNAPGSSLRQELRAAMLPSTAPSDAATSAPRASCWPTGSRPAPLQAGDWLPAVTAPPSPPLVGGSDAGRGRLAGSRRRLSGLLWAPHPLPGLRPLVAALGDGPRTGSPRVWHVPWRRGVAAMAEPGLAVRRKSRPGSVGKRSRAPVQPSPACSPVAHKRLSCRGQRLPAETPVRAWRGAGRLPARAPPPGREAWPRLSLRDPAAGCASRERGCGLASTVGKKSLPSAATKCRLWLWVKAYIPVAVQLGFSHKRHKDT